MVNAASIKGPCCALGGGFAVGCTATAAFVYGATFKAAGPSFFIYPVGGVLFALATIVAQATDSTFKQMGWTQYPNMRLLAAHAVTAIALAGVGATLIGLELGTSVALSVLLALAALGVNLVVRDFFP